MDAYNELLDSTITHLQDLKRRGVRYIPASPELLRAVSAPAGESKSFGSKPSERSGAEHSQRLSSAPPLAAAAVVKAVASRTASEPIMISPAQGKPEAIQELRERALVCQKCPNLASSRKNVVFGVGSIDAELMFVGEAPGADEDIEGEPFVGRAGQLLTKIIETMGLSRERVYIAN